MISPNPGRNSGVGGNGVLAGNGVCVGVEGNHTTVRVGVAVGEAGIMADGEAVGEAGMGRQAVRSIHAAMSQQKENFVIIRNISGL